MPRYNIYFLKKFGGSVPLLLYFALINKQCTKLHRFQYFTIIIFPIPRGSIQTFEQERNYISKRYKVRKVS